MDWKCILCALARHASADSPSFIVKCLEAYYPESLNCMIIQCVDVLSALLTRQLCAMVRGRASGSC